MSEPCFRTRMRRYVPGETFTMVLAGTSIELLPAVDVNGSSGVRIRRSLVPNGCTPPGICAPACCSWVFANSASTLEKTSSFACDDASTPPPICAWSPMRANLPG
jgi:hypothetical protein